MKLTDEAEGNSDQEHVDPRTEQEVTGRSQRIKLLGPAQTGLTIWREQWGCLAGGHRCGLEDYQSVGGEFSGRRRTTRLTYDKVEWQYVILTPNDVSTQMYMSSLKLTLSQPFLFSSPRRRCSSRE